MWKVTFLTIFFLSISCSSYNKRQPDSSNFKSVKFKKDEAFLKSSVNAKILKINYNLVRDNYQFTRNYTNDEIDDWLIKNYLLRKHEENDEREIEEETFREQIGVSETAGYRSILVPIADFMQEFVLEAAFVYVVEFEVDYLISKKQSAHVEIDSEQVELVHAAYRKLQESNSKAAELIKKFIYVPKYVGGCRKFIEKNFIP